MSDGVTGLACDADAAPLEYRRRLCVATRASPRGCPWARSSATWPASSSATCASSRPPNGAPGAEAPVRAPMMACHKDQADTAHPLRLCAGWLSVIGPHHLGVRMHLLTGRLADVPAPDASWPELHPDTPALLRSWAARLADALVDFGDAPEPGAGGPGECPGVEAPTPLHCQHETEKETRPHA